MSGAVEVGGVIGEDGERALQVVEVRGAVHVDLEQALERRLQQEELGRSPRRRLQLRRVARVEPSANSGLSGEAVSMRETRRATPGGRGRR